MFFGIKGFEPLNIRTKNEGLTSLAIFQGYFEYKIRNVVNNKINITRC